MLGCTALGIAATLLGGCGARPSTGTPSGRIDVHQHMVPEAYRRWLTARGVVDVGGLPVPEWSVSGALASMDRVGTAKALLSVSAPGVTPATNDAEATDIARTVNDAAAELAKDRPDRFGFLATVPLPAVDAAGRPGTRRAGSRRSGPAGPQRRYLPRAPHPEGPVGVAEAAEQLPQLVG